MAITFAYRSDQLAPRYTSVVTTHSPMALSADTAPALTASADTGVIGSTVLNVDKQTQPYRTYRFLGLGNIPLMTGGFSCLIRVIPKYTGSPGAASLGGLWSFTSFTNLPWAYLVHNTDGTFGARFLGGALSNNLLNVTTTATWSATSGTASDICMTWDGTTGTGGIGFWVDGTEIETATASAASDFTVNNPRYGEILPCTAPMLGNDGDYDLNEMVIWDSEIDPSSSGLDLSGSSRTSFVDVEENDQIPSGGGGGSTILGGLGLKK